jgi:hypothetical protein
MHNEKNGHVVSEKFTVPLMILLTISDEKKIKTSISIFEKKKKLLTPITGWNRSVCPASISLYILDRNSHDASYTIIDINMI